MSNKLDQIIDVSISLSTKTITQKGFGTPVFLGESMKLDRRVKSYANITEVAIDFASSDPEYKMASAAFSQEKTPASIMIGKKVVATSTAITAATNSSGDIVNINKTAHNLESGTSVTVTGFNEAEYNGTFEITKIDGDNFQYTAASTPSATPATGSGSYTVSETWANAIQKCFDFNSTWYALAITSAVEADILSAAGKIEVLKRIFLARSSDADNLDSADTGSILYQLKQLGYDRTFTIYNGDTANYFADAAWLGRQLPTTPGSSNWAFKSLTGIIADDLLSSQSSAVFTNNGNTYETFAGQSITRYGKVASGEWIDIIRGADWLQARLQENLYSTLINVEKIPYTDAGGDIIENKIREILDEGVENDFIAADADGVGKYKITVPDVADISSADKLARLFSGVSFTATLAGAVNKIAISGNLSV
tara:strand:- start:6053 stop:7327 length:1275 start_codon:yes stop_codon:yes gene_type:complete